MSIPFAGEFYLRWFQELDPLRYTFGTDNSAAARLEEIATFFNPFAINFIRENVHGSIDSAIDLGCGPGFTTDMLSIATECPKVYGFDKSGHSFQKMTSIDN